MAPVDLDSGKKAERRKASSAGVGWRHLVGHNESGRWSLCTGLCRFAELAQPGIPAVLTRSCSGTATIIPTAASYSFPLDRKPFVVPFGVAWRRCSSRMTSSVFGSMVLAACIFIQTFGTTRFSPWKAHNGSSINKAPFTHAYRLILRASFNACCALHWDNASKALGQQKHSSASPYDVLPSILLPKARKWGKDIRPLHFLPIFLPFIKWRFLTVISYLVFRSKFCSFLPLTQ